MAENHADFTLTFRRLCDVATQEVQHDGPVRTLFEDPEAFDQWAVSWRQRLLTDNRSDVERQTEMRRVNPAFIPRNHRVEEVIRAAEDNNDLDPFRKLLSVLARPCDDQPGAERYTLPPKPDEVVRQTFCGT